MKKEVVALLLLIVAVVLIGTKPWEKGVSQEDAKNFVLEDLRTKYPSAEITEILSSEFSYGSYKIKGRASFGLSTQCPQRLHLYYDYPASNFVTWTENITRNCQVCEGQPRCVIAFEEEAVAASHTYYGSEKVQAYISKYSDAKADYEFLAEFEGEKDVWKVTWNAPSASYKEVVYLSKNGNKIIKVVEQAK